MKLFTKILISLFLLSSTSFGTVRELEVQLKAAYPVMNFCIVSNIIFSTEDQKLYCDKLNNILAHNLTSGDIFKLTNIKTLSSEQKFLNSDIIASCKKEKTEFIIFIKTAYPEITVSLYNIHQQTTCTLTPRILSQDMQDVEFIYQTANLIHEKLVGIPGIAGSQILFSSSKTITSTENNFEESTVWITSLDSRPQPVLNEHKISLCPKFIPSLSHPSHYLFVSYNTGIPKIFLHNLKTNKSQKLIALKGNQLMPIMSYQKDKIAFISDTRGNPDLYIQNFSPEKGTLGAPIQLLSSDFGVQGNPCFSPDGKKIAFVSNKDGLPKVYLLSLDPYFAVPSLLTKKHRDSNCPSWSPDGKKIIFCSVTNGVRQLWLINLVSLEETQLTFCPSNKEDPSWAPNSTHVVFSMKKQNISDLYVLSLITKKVKKLTDGPGDKRFPSWEVHVPKKSWRIL